jgi:hypothetical protein
MKELSYVGNVLLEIRRFDRTLTSEDILDFDITRKNTTRVWVIQLLIQCY